MKFEETVLCFWGIVLIWNLITWKVALFGPRTNTSESQIMVQVMYRFGANNMKRCSACKAPVYFLIPSLTFSVNRIQKHKLKFILRHWVSSISGFNWNFYIQFPDKVISQVIISQLNFTQRSQNLSESLNRPQPVVQVSYAIWNKVNFHSVAWGFAEDPSQRVSSMHMTSLFCCSMHQSK